MKIIKNNTKKKQGQWLALGNEAKQEVEKSELEQKQEELAVKTELLLMATIIQESIRTRLENGEKLSDSDKAQFKAASASIQSLTGEEAGKIRREKCVKVIERKKSGTQKLT